MIHFFASILASALIFLTFKLFPRYGVKRFHAIVVNYWTAFLSGYLLSEPKAWAGILEKEWAYLVPLEGLLFISIFNVMGMTVQHHGVSIGSIASRTAMIIPAVLLMFLDPEESFSLLKIGAVALACLSVVLCTSKGGVKDLDSRFIYLPIILFIGSGLIDFIIGYVEHFLITDPDDAMVFIPSIFFIAACTGTLMAIWRYIKDPKEVFGIREVLAGIVLGIINYASLLFIIKAMETELISASLFFPVNNLGIVIAVVMMGYFVFSEKLNSKSWIGIVLGFLSICLMIFIAE